MKRAKKSGLRPTDGEIDLEARQWAEEYATRCENTQITRQEIFAAGARWARGVAQLGRPNPTIQGRADCGPYPASGCSVSDGPEKL